jgi:hypothetical protein
MRNSTSCKSLAYIPEDAKDRRTGAHKKENNIVQYNVALRGAGLLWLISTTATVKPFSSSYDHTSLEKDIAHHAS